MNKLIDLVNNSYNRIKFDSRKSLCKFLCISRRELRDLISENYLKIKGGYLYVNPYIYAGNDYIAKSVYDMFKSSG